MSLPPLLKGKNLLLGISFGRSKAQGYIPAVAIARNAALYHEHEEGGSVIHFAGFERSEKGAAQALALLDCLGNVRTVHIHTGSPVVWGSDRVREILRCYILASRCADRLAHCLTREFRELIPCKRLLVYFIYDPLHPSPAIDQLQAAAVEAGVEWCPMLDASDWGFVRERTKKRIERHEGGKL